MGEGGTQDPASVNPDSTVTEPGTSAEDTTGSDPGSTNDPAGTGDSAGTTGDPAGTAGPQAPDIDLEKIKPDESGKIMVVMFHNFILNYKPGGDKEWTTTLDDFRALLHDLYDRGYRLISLSDYLSGNIDVPAGCIPMVFTFDDATAGQFRLADNNGKLEISKNCAVAVMEEFYQEHPDFGLEGTFYVNLGDGAFPGAGTIEDRLKYLIDKGFEIGNHTYDHVHLPAVKTAAEIQKQVGANQKTISEMIPGYVMSSISLPYGEPSKTLHDYLIRGEYEGTQYENLAILQVGWDPNPSPISVKFDPYDTHRVRAQGIEPVNGDLTWWFARLTRSDQFVSDGDPSIFTVPESKKESVSVEKLRGRKLFTY